MRIRWKMNVPSGSTRWPQPLLRSFLLCTLLLVAVPASGCGAGASGTSVGTNTSTGTVPQFSHVVVGVEENASYPEVIGGSAMPYLNSLAKQYGVATQYFGNVHPSIGNYVMMTTGTLATADDNFTGTANGGGHVATVVVSQQGKAGFKGMGKYQHQNLLRTIAEVPRLSHIPGEGATAGNMGEFV